jgi:hypothetical protein
MPWMPRRLRETHWTRPPAMVHRQQPASTTCVVVHEPNSLLSRVLGTILPDVCMKKETSDCPSCATVIVSNPDRCAATGSSVMKPTKVASRATHRSRESASRATDTDVLAQSPWSSEVSPVGRSQARSACPGSSRRSRTRPASRARPAPCRERAVPSGRERARHGQARRPNPRPPWSAGRCRRWPRWPRRIESCPAWRFGVDPCGRSTRWPRLESANAAKV